MIPGHPIFTGFRKLTSCQRDPRDMGVTRDVRATEEVCRDRYFSVMTYLDSDGKKKFDPRDLGRHNVDV